MLAWTIRCPAPSAVLTCIYSRRTDPPGGFITEHVLVAGLAVSATRPR